MLLAATRLPHFSDQVSDQRVHHPLEGLAGPEAGSGIGVLAQHGIVTASKQCYARADLLQREDPGIHAVVKIGGQISDLVCQIDQLRLEGRPQAEEIFRKFRVLTGIVVAGMLDDAFAHAERQVEPAERGVALFKPGDDAKRVQVVIKAEPAGAQGVVERLFAGMTERGMAYVVDQGERLGQIGVQAQGRGHGPRDLRHFKRVRQAAAEVVSGVIAGKAGEHLRLAGQATKSARVQNARAVPGKWCTVSMRPLGMHSMRELAIQIAAHGDARR